MKKLLLIISMLVMPLIIKAQGVMDVYDFSTSFYQGTAKAAAMGNAMGAVGQDFSSISINPAGLGLFRHTTVVFTPGVYISNTNATFNSSYNKATEVRIPINNGGAVIVFPANNGVLKSVNLSVGMNRINNRTKETFASGTNSTSSLVDAYFIDLYENGIYNSTDLESFSPSYIFPLWSTYVIGNDAGTNLYTTPVPIGNINQQRGILQNGFTDEINISLGFNLDDKWFLGASLDIPRNYRYMVADYKETNLQSGTFLNWMQEEVITTNGWGVGGKFGLIGFPARWLRFGLSIHTPTLYNLQETWKTYTTSQFKNTNHNNNSYTSGPSYYNYKLTTPMRFDASLAFIFGSNGMLTFDYEFVDYRSAYLYCREYDYSYVNSAVRSTFKATSNFRLGGEYRVKNVCFRAGYAFYGSPYGLSSRNYRTNNFSAGIGYSMRSFAIDFAYVYSRYRNDYYVYSPYSNYVPDGDDVAANTISEITNNHLIAVTLKFKLD